MSVSEWIPDLSRRLSQLDGITAMQQSLSNIEVWLGGLFFPEAYITATRQAVAHRKRWSLETLSLRLDIGQMDNPGAFIVDGELRVVFWFESSNHPGSGLTLEGAAWDAEAEKLVLNDGEAVHLSASQIRWVQEEEDATDQSDLVTLPVYLNGDRSDVMFTVDLPFDGSSASLVAMRAVCLNARG